MASASTSWMPPQGKYQVTVGTSLRRALKARKEGGTPPATNPKRIPDKDFYSFRYNFKPPAIDSTKPGTIEVKKGKDKTQVVVEHLSSQVDEAYVYTGSEVPAKEWNCILIYDEETGAYTLEKLDSFVALQWERKRTPTARASSPAMLSPSDKDAEGDDDDELEKELLGLTEDVPLAKKPNTNVRRPVAPPKPPPQRQEVEDAEDIFIPPVPDPVPKPPPPKAQPTKAARPTKPLPKSRPSAAAAAAAKPIEPTAAPVVTAPLPAVAPKPKAPKLKKRKDAADPPPPNELDAEDLNFGVPAKRAKLPATGSVTAPQPPAEPKPSAGFALPGSDAGYFQPPAPAPTVKPQRAPPLPVQPVVPEDEEESDTDWIEVVDAAPATDPPAAAASPGAMSYHSDNGDEDGGLFGYEDDGDGDGDGDAEDFLADELAKEMGLDEGFDNAGSPHGGTQPMSLSDYVRDAGLGEDSDDDSSSSDDSDDY